jgi:pimeloyl-ACP methyl ester carboxylesterase
LAVLLSSTAWAFDASCKLKYPIVLSHLWSTGPICPDASKTGALSCEQVQDYNRYCAQKSTNPSTGERKCLQWRVPDDEADLPPRDYNVYDRTLVRDLRANMRYFSKAVVDKLKTTCGNKVYIADKPPFASYEVRARVLRSTVLQALRETGAAKVNLIGVSQGVQDARYMAMALPVSDAQPSGPKMGSKVASIVSLVGEDGGTDSASLGLDLTFAASLGNWSAPPAEVINTIAKAVSEGSWKRRDQAMNQPGVLVEQCRQAAECDLSAAMTRYRWFMRAAVNLSVEFMKPTLTQELTTKVVWGWDGLRRFVNEPYRRWADVVSPQAEAASGIRYMAYGAVLRAPHPAWSGWPTFLGVTLTSGENDSNVSLQHQMFSNPSPNFENLKVMRGSLLSKGYHHTFFTGHNDPFYSPVLPEDQEPAPYGGGSAAFYHQLARDMQARGL